jgi:hypothetical protein
MSYEKFKSRPTDSNTDVMEHKVYFGDIPAIMELWIWDGFSGSSVIFHKEDIKKTSDKDLIEIVFEHIKQPIDPKCQVKVSDEFIFVTFNVKCND